MFKKFLKIFGICIAIMTGIMGIAVGVFALIGGFNPKAVGMTKIFFGTEDVTEQELVIKDDTSFTISYLPDNATDLTLRCVTNSQAVTVPATIKAGEEFTVVVNKDANGRNVGGSAYIEFVSDSKSSESNLVKPCKLRLTVDVPVENNDLEYNIGLRRIDSALDPNVDTSQYIISKSATAEFDLSSTKDNIFDTNKWNKDESKKTYFSYVINSQETALEYNTDSYFTDATAPILAKYVTRENLYRFKLQPANISASTMQLITRTHRAYEVQKDFENYSYNNSSYVLDYFRTGGEHNGIDFTTLLKKRTDDMTDAEKSWCQAYFDFLSKYEAKYFANSSAEASSFFASLSKTKDNNNNEIIDINATNNYTRITESLKYVFVTKSVSFYISDVTVSSLDVSESIITLDLADTSTPKITFEEFYSILATGSVSGRDEKNTRSLKSTFNITIGATNTSSGLEVVEAAKESLLQGVEVKVLVYDATGLYVENSKYTTPANNANKSNNSSNWAGFTAETSANLYEFIKDAAGNEIPTGTSYSPYLDITKYKDKDTNVWIWKFAKKNISKKDSNFQIYLEFSLKVNDPSGEKIFYNYTKVNIVDNSDAAITATEASKNLNFANIIYTNAKDGEADKAFNNGVNRTSQEAMREVVVNEPKSTYGYIPYNSYKLFAYLGVQGDNNTININTPNYGETNSVLAKNLFDNSLYNIIQFDSSKVVTFQNLQGENLYWTNLDNQSTQIFKKVEAGDTTSKLIYAYELTSEQVNQITQWKLQAQNVSSNNVIIFGCYVLTNEAGRPINREGYELYTYDDKGNIAGTHVINKVEGKDQYEFVANSTIGVTYQDGTTPINYQVAGKDDQGKDITIDKFSIVQYVSLSKIDFSHTMQSKMIIEHLYYYTFNSSDTIVKLTEGEGAEYLTNKATLRNTSQSDKSRMLRLINNQSYNSVLSVYPYELEREEWNGNQITKLQKNNYTLAFREMINNTGFDFVVYNNAGYTDTSASITIDTKEVVDGLGHWEVGGKSYYSAAPVKITITANTATDEQKTTIIKVSDVYTAASIYSPAETVDIKISNINISNFSKLFITTDQENEFLANILSVSGKIVASSKDNNWDWTNQLLYDSRFGLPRIYSIKNGMLELGVDKAANGNISIGGTLGNVVTNLIDSLSIQPVIFYLGGEGGTQSITKYYYQFDFSGNKLPIVDYSLVSEDYLNYCIATYLFELTGCNSVATYEPIVTVVNELKKASLTTTTDGEPKPVYQISNEIIEALGLPAELESTSTIYEIAIQYAKILTKLQESIKLNNSIDIGSIELPEHQPSNSSKIESYTQLSEIANQINRDNSQWQKIEINESTKDGDCYKISNQIYLGFYKQNGTLTDSSSTEDIEEQMNKLWAYATSLQKITYSQSLYNSNNVNYYLPAASGAPTADKYVNVDAIYTFDDMRNAIIAMAKSDYDKYDESNNYYYEKIAGEGQDNKTYNLFDYIIKQYDQWNIYSTLSKIDKKDDWESSRFADNAIKQYILYSYNAHNANDAKKLRNEFSNMTAAEVTETFDYRYEYLVKFVLEHNNGNDAIIDKTISEIIVEYNNVYDAINKNRIDRELDNIRLQELFNNIPQLGKVNSGFETIKLTPTISNISDYVNFFNGSSYLITSGSEIIGLSVKLNSDGSIPLSETNIDPIIYINCYTIWRFGNNAEDVTKYYQIKAEFAQPTFEFNDTADITTENGIKVKTISKDIVGGGTYPISDLFNAYNDRTILNELCGKISYTIDNVNYAYFDINNEHKGTYIGYTDTDATTITFASTFEAREVRVTCTIGKTILIVKFEITANLKATNNLSTAKFVSYNSNAQYNAGGNVQLSDDVTGNATATTIVVTPYSFNGNTIKYTFDETLFNVNGKIDGVTFEVSSLQYQDFRGEWENISDITSVIDLTENTRLLANNTLSIAGEYYTMLRLTLNIRYNDETIATQTINIYPTIKLEVSGLTAVDNNNSYYYRYASANGDIITNGYKLYGDNGIIKLSYLSRLDVTDGVFTYEYLTTDSLANKLNFAISEDNSANSTNEYNYKWSYGLSDSGFVVRDQFLTKGEDDKYSQTDLGKILFTKSGNKYSINNSYVSVDGEGVVTLAAINQSFVLPITISLNAEVNKSITILLPFAGYKFSYKTNSGSYASATMQYNETNKIYEFAFDKLIADAGSSRMVRDDISIAFADNTANILPSASIPVDYAMIYVDIYSADNGIAAFKQLGEGANKVKDNYILEFNELAGQDNVNTYPKVSIKIVGYEIIGDKEYKFPTIKVNDGTKDKEYNNIIFTYAVKPSVSTTLAADGDYIIINNTLLATDGAKIAGGTTLADFVSTYFVAKSNGTDAAGNAKEYTISNITTKSFDYKCDGYGLTISFDVTEGTTVIDTKDEENVVFTTEAAEYKGTIVVRGKGGTLSEAIPFTISIPKAN